MTKITRNTLIPLGMAMTMIGGGAGWATRQEIIVAENARQIELADKKFEDIQRKLVEISERLGRIEGQLRGHRNGY